MVVDERLTTAFREETDVVNSTSEVDHQQILNPSAVRDDVDPRRELLQNGRGRQTAQTSAGAHGRIRARDEGRCDPSR